MQVTDPIDGAVLHPRLDVTAAGVEVDIRGKADPDSDVRINGVAAVREGEAFSTVLLRTENVVMCRRAAERNRLRCASA